MTITPGRETGDCPWRVVVRAQPANIRGAADSNRAGPVVTAIGSTRK